MAHVYNQAGNVAAAGLKFCPIQAVTKFPYKNVSRHAGEAISAEFFNNGKIFQRAWDLYYVWSPHFPSNKPLVFVTLDQFQALIAEVDRTFPSLLVRIPANSEEAGLIVGFGLHPSLRPRFLGRSNNREEFKSLEARAEEFEDAFEMYQPDERSLTTFKRYMEAAFDATKNKSKAIKERKREEKVVRQQDMGRQLKRAQRYLGLRARSASSDAQTPGLARSTSPMPRNYNVMSPSPFPFDGDVIFIAVDIESYERNHNIITEIGIATLDTRDLDGKPSGVVGKDWHRYIRARHFRIKDYLHLVNVDFVKGCPENFEFGESEIVAYTDSQKAVADCFKEPFSKPVHVDVSRTYGFEQKRNIIFLGHDTMQDVNYLRKLGYDPTNLPNLAEFLDTKAMYQSYSREVNPRSLGHILYELDLEGWSLHNAGNDAVYTVQAMLGICVRASEMMGDNANLRTSEREQVLHRNIDAARMEAEERVRDNAKGWSDDEDDDGGVPVKPQSSSNASLQRGRRASYGVGEVSSRMRGLAVGGSVNSSAQKKKIAWEEQDWCM
ncbi:hypothetical protein MBLNU459_g6515t2 [Dothideomycetes sp. NU459]